MAGADEVTGWADAIRAFGTDWPPEGADACGTAIDSQIALDTGGDNTLSNLGGAIVVRTAGSGTDWSVFPGGNVGALAILESGTKPHVIAPKRAKALMTPAGPRAMVEHQGAAARHTWTRGVEDGLREAHRSAEQAFREVSK